MHYHARMDTGPARRDVERRTGVDVVWLVLALRPRTAGGLDPPPGMFERSWGGRTPPPRKVRTLLGGSDPPPSKVSAFKCTPPPGSDLRLIQRDHGPDMQTLQELGG